MLTRHRWLLIPVTAGLLGIGAAALGAAEADEHQKEMTAEVVAVDTETGTLTVKKIDAEAGEVSRHEEYEAKRAGVEGERMTLVVSTDTRLTEDGGTLVALADLRPGEIVSITYSDKTGEMRAMGVDKRKKKETER